MKTLVPVVVLLSAPIAVGAAERILQIEEADHLANRTAAFNQGAGLCETRCGITGFNFRTDEKTDFHKSFFKFAESPKAKDWTMLFKFRPTGAEPREFGLKLYFGDSDDAPISLDE